MIFAGISQQPSNVIVCIVKNATFTCIVNAQNLENLRSAVFNKDRAKFAFVTNRLHHILSAPTMSSNGDLSENLTIVNATMSDNAALYRCNPITDTLSIRNVTLSVAGLYIIVMCCILQRI